MKIKNCDLEKYKNGFNELLKERLPIVMSVVAIDNIKVFDGALETYNAARKSTIETRAKKDENGNLITKTYSQDGKQFSSYEFETPELGKEVFEMINQLDNTENELVVGLINKEELMIRVPMVKGEVIKDLYLFLQ